MPSPYKKDAQNKGFLRFTHTIRYSINGVKAAWKYEESFRQELLLAMILIPLGIYLGNGAVEKLLLSGSIFFVLIVELINSAVETTVDRISGEYHELSGRAKDIASAAVLGSIIVALATWSALLIPRFV